ncbi:MAG: riboflavin synthase [Pirellulaceae bacterium]|nr:riboflavin synthase [Pirellulaceae bacterium]
MAVFTGLVERKANLIEMIPEGPGMKVVVDGGELADGVAIGDSISVSGCCLTVIELDGQQLAFQAGEETLSRTTLGDKTAGDFVNLERSLKADARMGGHFVSGHVDAVGTVDRRIDDEDWSTYWFKVPKALMSEIASKGSVTVDGISLTVVGVEEQCFSVALIPHTLQVTTLGDYAPGAHVNLETDILAKYVGRQLQGHLERIGGQGTSD